MATRPVFVPCQRSGCFIEEVQITFHWHAGVAPIQKKRNVTELHAAASVKGLSQILEVSTKSDDKLGQRLSSFNLRVSRSDGSTIPLESAYQGSKVFTDGGPFNDLFVRDPREAKRDGRLKSSGRLIGFKFDKSEWELEPRTAFYDWLYLYALKDHSEYLRRLYKYDAFSDIEFNPNSSINTQA